MKTNLTISIAMAVYNGVTYIGEQLESFTRQTILPDELVVTDDASTDATQDIITTFAARAPFPVRIEKNAERLGYKANFMKAAGLCRSDLIAFSDQDDVWLPHKLATCLAAFDNNDTLLTYHEAIVVTEKLEPIGFLEHQQAPLSAVNSPRSIEPWRYGLGFTLMFRRSLLAFADQWAKSANFYQADQLEAHDQWFFFLASCLGTIGYVTEPLALYRQHGTNTYGWSYGNSGIRWKWRNLMDTNVASFKSREIAAAKRASILERIQPGLDNEGSNRADMAAASYRKLEAVYRLRQEIYKSGNVLSKLTPLIAALRSGGYRPQIEWGVGGQALVRDVVRGIVFPAKTQAGI